MFEDIARTVLHNKKNSLTERITSVGFRASISTGEPGQGGTAGQRRAVSLPAQVVRRINTLRRGNTANTVRLANKADPATKSRWKCSIL